MAENGIRHIVDLGCGDFRVGRLLKLSPAVRYTGIDVVPELIQFNQEHFRTASVDFRTANIIEDPLPNGGLCLIRQVLQHMSNQQIAKVIASCSRYRYVLITEDLYAGPDLRPNLENPGGWDTRTYEKSGVFLDLPPFNLPLRTVLEISGVGAVPTILRTALLERSKPLPSEP